MTGIPKLTTYKKRNMKLRLNRFKYAAILFVLLSLNLNPLSAQVELYGTTKDNLIDNNTFEVFFPIDSIGRNSSFQHSYDVISNILSKNKVEVYDDELLKSPIDYNTVEEDYLTRIDTLSAGLSQMKDYGYVDNYFIIKQVINNQSITGYKVKGTWSYDDNYGNIEYVILSISPVAIDLLNLETTEVEVADNLSHPLYWIKYSDIEKTLIENKIYLPIQINSYDITINGIVKNINSNKVSNKLKKQLNKGAIISNINVQAMDGRNTSGFKIDYSLDSMKVDTLSSKLVFDKILKRALTEETLTIYSEYLLNEKISKTDLTYYITRSDTLASGYSQLNQFGIVDDEYIKTQTTNSNDLSGFKVKGIWLYDKSEGKLKYKIEAIGFLVKELINPEYEKVSKDSFELFWINYSYVKDLDFRIDIKGFSIGIVGDKLIDVNGNEPKHKYKKEFRKTDKEIIIRNIRFNKSEFYSIF